MTHSYVVVSVVVAIVGDDALVVGVLHSCVFFKNLTTNRFEANIATLHVYTSTSISLNDTIIVDVCVKC